jgi:hypothetical protein
MSKANSESVAVCLAAQRHSPQPDYEARTGVRRLFVLSGGKLFSAE